MLKNYLNGALPLKIFNETFRFGPPIHLIKKKKYKDLYWP